MISDKIKTLREQKDLTQSELARLIGITRSSVNAWEMGISVPSTQYIVELSNIFKVSSDFLLGLDSSATVNVTGLTQNDIEFIHATIEYLRTKNRAADTGDTSTRYLNS